MSHRLIALAAALSSLAAFAAGCGIVASVDRNLIPTEGVGGGGGQGGMGGAGGGCTDPSECPAPSDPCLIATCDDGTCGEGFQEAGAPCPEGVCNGAGTCVGCVEDTDCDADQTCDGETCVPTQCANGVVDPGETDVDCGGSTCPPCENGLSCELLDDCQSRFCDGGTCAACSAGDCIISHWCDEGTGECIEKAPVGDPCTDPVACLSDACTDGVCCERPCKGPCQACNQMGACLEHAQGTDPEMGCGPDTCSGDGACETCGDGNAVGDETCDDGDTESFDGCSASCRTEVGHLLLSEIVTAPTTDAFVEIYNPTTAAVDLTNVYLADFPSYYDVTAGNASPSTSDFLLQFPSGSSIPAGGFVTVSLDSASSFSAAWSTSPDFDLDSSDDGAPVMLGTFDASNSGLDASNEPLVLFTWDGAADLVTDVDYVVYGDTSEVVDKTNVTINGSSYDPDTAAGTQVAATAPPSGQALHRCDTAETTETTSGGNGTGGHDETSEDGAAAWTIATTPSPGAVPSTGLCP